MAYQFVHANTYSIKSGGAGIAAENDRVPDHCPHVENPKEPILLAGMRPTAAWSEIERRHEKARDTVALKNGGTAERRLRKDANVLLAAVASYPEPTETIDVDGPEFQDWQKRTIDWLTKQHGEPLSVVMHLDESHPHIHFLTAPDLEAGQRMPDIHVGEKAKAEIGGRAAGRVEKRQAFTKAMRAYQDSYHAEVGMYHAQARLGPRRQRLTRDEWKAQQAEAIRQAERLRDLERQRQQIQEMEEDLGGDKAAVAAASAEVGKERNELEAQRQEVAKAEAGVTAAHEKLDARRDDLKNTYNNVKGRIEEVSAREKRLAGLWGSFVSAVTLGRAGTEKRVQKAVEAVRAEFKTQISTQTAEAENANAASQRAIRNLDDQKDKLARQNRTLKTALQKAQEARQAAETKVETLTAKIQPLEAENAAVKANRAQLLALIDDMEDAAQAGDLEQIRDLLNPNIDRPGLG